MSVFACTSRVPSDVAACWNPWVTCVWDGTPLTGFTHHKYRLHSAIWLNTRSCFPFAEQRIYILFSPSRSSCCFLVLAASVWRHAASPTHILPRFLLPDFSFTLTSSLVQSPPRGWCHGFLHVSQCPTPSPHGRALSSLICTGTSSKLSSHLSQGSVSASGRTRRAQAGGAPAKGRKASVAAAVSFWPHG